MKHCPENSFRRTFLIATLLLQTMFYGSAVGQCFITADTLNCVIGAGEVEGITYFINPPANGQFVITGDDGTNTVQTVINPPFISPISWTVSGMDPTVNPYDITIQFTAEPGCTAAFQMNCGCSAYAGTTTASMAGNSISQFVLCDGDQISINSNLDFMHPDDIGPLGGIYNFQPQLIYLIYNCLPLPNTFPNDDPCFIGILDQPVNLLDVNGPGSIFDSYNPALFTDNEVFYVPANVYHYDPINDNYIVNSNCYDIGAPTQVTYLPPITSVEVEDCFTASVTSTISGGYPAVYGGSFTLSNLSPVTATLSAATVVNGGTVTINGLQNGEAYSFDVTDANGCPHTISGGPVVFLPNTDAGADDTTCTLTYQLNAVPDAAAGVWTTPAGITFDPNVNDPNAVITANAPGTYNFTWSETNGPGCIGTDDVSITFSDLSIPSTITDVSCFGSADGQVVVAPQGGVAPYSYAWTSGGNAAIESNLPPGPVIVTVTDDAGCSLDSSFVIAQPDDFTFSTESQNAICDQPTGWAAVIGIAGANGNFVYDWGTGFTNNDTLFNATPGIYSVTVADNGGVAPFCDTTVSIEVFNTIQQPTLDSVVTNALCNVSCDGEAAIIPVGIAPFVYTWDPFVTLDSVGVGLCPGPYQVTVADANNCTAVIDVIVGSPPPITVQVFSDDSLICQTDSIILGATVQGGTPPYQSYSWSSVPGDVTLDTDTITPVVFPTDTTVYTLVVTDDNGCTSTPVSHQIDVFPPFTLDVISPIGGLDTSICPYDTAFIELQVMGGDGSSPTLYVMPDSLTPVSLPFPAQPEVDSTYVFMATDGCILPAIDSVTVGLHPLPPVDFSVNDSANCIPFEVEFTASDDTTLASVTWDFGDVNSSDNLGIELISTHTYQQSGLYDITITATSDQGCIDDSTYTQFIEAFPSPMAIFSADPLVTTILNANIRFEDASFNNIAAWQWDFGDGSNSFIQHPRHLYDQTGTYTVLLHVTDTNSCTDTTSLDIEVQPDFTFYVPNAFSPNNDGKNDTFRGEGQGFYRNTYEFNIYNRWGDNIYSTANFDNRWDGTFRGRQVESAVYVYRIELVDFLNLKHVYIGHVTLYR